MPSTSKSQQRLFGMVHACQKSGKCASDKIKDIAKDIKPKDADDFAKTKHKGLPERKDEGFFSWLERRDPDLYKEITSTADVALFARPIGGMVRRDQKNKKKSCGCKEK